MGDACLYSPHILWQMQHRSSIWLGYCNARSFEQGALYSGALSWRGTEDRLCRQTQSAGDVMAGQVGFQTRKQIARSVSALRPILEVSQETYNEIADLLLGAGHGHRFAAGLSWPIILDGLEIQPAFEAIEAGGQAPPIYASKKR